MKTICKNLNLLASHYPSITEFAKHIGFSRQTVGFWLADQRTPTAEAITAICEKEKVSADWLLEITPFSAVRRDAKEELHGVICDINLDSHYYYRCVCGRKRKVDFLFREDHKEEEQ